MSPVVTLPDTVRVSPPHFGISAIAAGVVTFAAIHQRLRWRGEDTSLYGLAFDDGSTFFSKRQPRFYDAMAKPMTPREVLPGTYVNVRYNMENGINRMSAVQIVRPPEEVSPFDPVLDDGHL
jgi:hypothetical protein